MAEVNAQHIDRAEVAVDRGSIGWGMTAGHFRDTVKLVAQALADAEQRGRREEQAAVKAWLDDQGELELADGIEHGLHLKGEE